jgi:hypothetical protein
VKIYHLLPDVHRAGRSILDYVESEAPVERQHGVGVLHRERDMIETAHASSILSQGF